MNDALGSPAMIRGLLNVYTLPDVNGQVGDSTLQSLVNLGAVDWVPGGKPHVTELGIAWIRALEKVTAPRQVFVDQNNNIL